MARQLPVDALDSPLSSAASTEPLPSEDEAEGRQDDRPRVVSNGPRARDARLHTDDIAGTGDSNDEGDHDDDEDDEEEPLPRTYGRTRPIKEIKARRRAAGTESTLTSQSDSDTTDRPVPSTSRSARSSPRKVVRRKAADVVSEASDPSPGEQRDSTSPEVYRPRPGSLPRSAAARRRPPAEDSETSGLPTPVSPPAGPLVVNGRKRRRSELTSSARSAKAARRAAAVKRPLANSARDAEEEANDALDDDPAQSVAGVDETMAADDVDEADRTRPPLLVAASQQALAAIQAAVEAEGEAGSDRENDGLTDASKRARLEAMEELTRIEIKLVKVREALFVERSDANARERDAIENGTHSDLVEFTQFLNEKRTSRLRLAKQMFDNTERMVDYQLGVHERNAWRWWEDAKRALRSDLLRYVVRQRRRHDRDRTFGIKWEKSEHSDKYREIYADHERRKALTEEMAEVEHLRECEARRRADGINPLDAASVRQDLEALAIRPPQPHLPESLAPSFFTSHSTLTAPYDDTAASKNLHSAAGMTGSAAYSSAASPPPVPYPARSMPTTLSLAAFQRSGLETEYAGGRQALSPTASPSSATQSGASPRLGHAHRPSLDAHVATKSAPSSNTASHGRFVLPPIPPYSGGTRTHSGMGLSSSSLAPSSASATAMSAGPTVSSASAASIPVGPTVSSAAPALPMPAFRFPPVAPVSTQTAST